MMIVGRKEFFIAGIFWGILLFGIAPRPLSAAEVSDQCAMLLNTRCEQCHYKTRICHKLGKKTRRSWRITLKRMVKYGAKLSREEQKELVECLSSLPEGAEIVCK